VVRGLPITFLGSAFSLTFLLFRLRDHYRGHTNIYTRYYELLKAETDYVRNAFAIRTHNKYIYHGFHAEPIQNVLTGYPRKGVDTVEAPDEPTSSLTPLTFCIWNGPDAPPDYWPEHRVELPPVLPPIDSLL